MSILDTLKQDSYASRPEGAWGARGYGNDKHKIDCSTALGFLSFVLFLNVLRDTIEDIIASQAAAAGMMDVKRRRSKRSIEVLYRTPDHNILNYQNMISESIQFLENLKVASPNISYKKTLFCKVNKRLSEIDRTIGPVFGALMTNLVLSNYSDSDQYIYGYAAKQGRREGHCQNYNNRDS